MKDRIGGYVTIFNGRWAWGKTHKASMYQARKRGITGCSWVTFRVPGVVVNAYVNNWGGLCWDSTTTGKQAVDQPERIDEGRDHRSSRLKCELERAESCDGIHKEETR